MRQVDQLLARHTRKEVLVAAGKPDHLVREHRTDHDRQVRLGNVPVDPYIHGDVAHQTTGQLGQPLRFDPPQRRERLRQPRLVIDDGPAGIGLLGCARGVTQMAGEMVLTHPLVGTEGDHHSDLFHSALEGGVHRPHQQGQWARPGAIRDDQADPLVIKISSGKGTRHEGADLVAGELLADTTTTSARKSRLDPCRSSPILLMVR